MGHHALAHGSTSLLVGKQWLGEMEMEERESGWFESKRYQIIHRKHKNRQVRNVLRVAPHPPYIVFPRGFRVLSPQSRLQPLFWAFSPFQGFSPFLRDLAPGGLFWALFWGFQPFSSSLGSFGGVGVKWKVLWSEMSVVRRCRPLRAVWGIFGLTGGGATNVGIFPTYCYVIQAMV